MNGYTKITLDNDFTQKYWMGPGNLVARYYAYLQKGFELVNQSKNYFFILFGGYWTVRSVEVLGYKLNADAILILGLLGLPILAVVGRWYLFRASKSIEYIIAQHGTVTQYNSYNLQIDILNELEKLNRNLEKYHNGNKLV